MGTVVPPLIAAAFAISYLRALQAARGRHPTTDDETDTRFVVA